MSNDKFKGYHFKLAFLRNKMTKSYERVYVLYDENKLVGVFEDEMFANRYWVRSYIPSHRTEIKINETYEMREGLNNENQYKSE